MTYKAFFVKFGLQQKVAIIIKAYEKHLQYFRKPLNLTDI